MNVWPHAVQLKDGWIPQIRYGGYQVDRLRPDSYVDGEVIWERQYRLFDTADEAVADAREVIDEKIKGLFA